MSGWVATQFRINDFAINAHKGRSNFKANTIHIGRSIPAEMVTFSRLLQSYNSQSSIHSSVLGFFFLRRPSVCVAVYISGGHLKLKPTIKMRLISHVFNFVFFWLLVAVVCNWILCHCYDDDAKCTFIACCHNCITIDLHWGVSVGTAQYRMRWK